MIHLPEIEIMRRDLERDVTTKRVKTVEVNATKVVKRGGTKAKFASALDGVRIDSTARVGMWILFYLDSGQIMASHMGSGGMWRRNTNKAKVEPKTTLVIGFTQHGQLRLVDAAGEAEVFVVADEEALAEKVPELESFGMDPLATPMSWTDFGRTVLNLRPAARLKTMLTDNSIVCGLGDTYSDEILFNAGLRYDRMTDSLNTQEIRRFYRGLVETLHDAVKYRGTTLETAPFADVFGEPGNFGDHLQVFGKHGQLSPRTRQPLVRTKFAGRWTYYCEQSQV